MTLLQLQYFCALAEDSNLHKTAEHFRVNPSTLSEAMAKLEKELGTELFDRIKNRLLLNEAGKK